VAGFLNVSPNEIALTRGATEALQALIGGYNKLKPGDTVLYADLDYSEMKNAMRWLEVRRGVKAVKLTFPEPTIDRPLQEADILGFYEKALSANPGTKLLLLTHLNNWTGLIIPVARIAKMARDRGVDVILDAAHSVGQVELNLKDLAAISSASICTNGWAHQSVAASCISRRTGSMRSTHTWESRPTSRTLTDASTPEH
jgi:selenocysteine lyase/cysteine desulfurase